MKPPKPAPLPDLPIGTPVIPTDAQTIARLRALAERWERNGVPHGEAILEILDGHPWAAR